MLPLNRLQAQGLPGNKTSDQRRRTRPLATVPLRSLFLTTIEPFNFHVSPFTPFPSTRAELELADS